MHQDIILKLSLGMQYLHHANFAGTPRQAVADGYSAVDATLSALLLQDGDIPPKNHKAKLDLCRKNYPDAFAPERIRRKNSAGFSPGADWDSLESFYRQWLTSRYDPFQIGNAAASSRVSEAGAAFNAAIRFIARKENIEADELRRLTSVLAFGYESSEVARAVGKAHGRLVYEAEQYGAKFSCTANYCDLDITTGDELTQTILREDDEIAHDAAVLYHNFNQLVEKIISRRLQCISGNKLNHLCSDDEVSASPDFMLSLKARYHGGTLNELANLWGKGLAEALSAVLDHKETEPSDTRSS